MSTIKSKEDPSYVVGVNDLLPLTDNGGTIGKGVTPLQLSKIMNSYGSILSTDTAAAQVPGVTPVLLTGFDEDGLSSLDVTPNNALDKITVARARDYKVSAQFSFLGTNSAEFDFEIYRDLAGTPTPTGIRGKRTLGAAGAIGSCSLVGIVALAAGEELGVYVNSDSAAYSITVAEAQLVLESVD